MTASAITAAIGAANDAGRPALVAFLTAGFPAKESFRANLEAIAAAADVVEIGVPFTDPLADGVTIQHSSRVALEAGVSLEWILDEVAASKAPGSAPLLLMSYLNPLLAYGYPALAARSAEAGVSGFIVPDLPLEESGPLREELDKHALALVQLVTPVTPDERLRMLCEASSGFVYAVTVTGVTGGGKAAPAAGAGVAEYLERVHQVSTLPVCAGFGIRRAEQVRELAPHAEGLIVGSALVEALERGDDPAAFINALRG